MNKYEREIIKLEKNLTNGFKKLAKKYRKEVIIPTCKKLNLVFQCCQFYDYNGEFGSYPEIDKMLDTLHYDSSSYNMFSTLVDDYDPRKNKK
jgi:hypothetical protein